MNSAHKLCLLRVLSESAPFYLLGSCVSLTVTMHRLYGQHLASTVFWQQSPEDIILPMSMSGIRSSLHWPELHMQKKGSVERLLAGVLLSV